MLKLYLLSKERFVTSEYIPEDVTRDCSQLPEKETQSFMEQRQLSWRKNDEFVGSFTPTGPNYISE